MFTMSLELLTNAPEMLAVLEQIAGGKHYTGAELKGRTRDPVTSDKDGRQLFKGGDTNAQVLDWLAKGGRDFRNTRGDADRIGAAFVKHAIEAIGKHKLLRGYSGSKDSQSMINALAKATAAKTGRKVKVENIARSFAGAGFREAMKEYMRVVSENIEKGKFEGGGSKELSKQYAIFKQLHKGFTKPIGKFSGQLPDNLNPKGPNARNIKLIRGKVKK